MTVIRHEPPQNAAERPMLEGWLDYHRATLLLKCEGLEPDQLIARAVPPSTLSLLGLVRHMAEVERFWFRRAVDGQDLPDLYGDDDERDADFDRVDEADPAEDRALLLAEVEAAREIAARYDLDHLATHPRDGDQMSLRWVLTHMIEEYARHNGHADLLREAIDGTTGD
jgi:uncharacterized damage-inducible protein DinB